MLPEDQNEQQARPSWVTDELLEKTMKVWSRVLGRQVSLEEAIELVKEVGRLVGLIYPDAKSG